MSGYVAIPTGRSRSTEDIDIVLDPLADPRLEELADRLNEEGYWRMAMPLADLAEMLSDGDRLRVAEDGDIPILRSGLPQMIWNAKRSRRRSPPRSTSTKSQVARSNSRSPTNSGL